MWRWGLALMLIGCGGDALTNGDACRQLSNASCERLQVCQRLGTSLAVCESMIVQAWDCDALADGVLPVACIAPG